MASIRITALGPSDTIASTKCCVALSCRAVTVTVASPYARQADIVQAATTLKDAACDLIVVYCMGFNRQLTRPIRKTTAKPVIVSSTIVARTIGELLE